MSSGSSNVSSEARARVVPPPSGLFDQGPGGGPESVKQPRSVDGASVEHGLHLFSDMFPMAGWRSQPRGSIMMHDAKAAGGHTAIHARPRRLSFSNSPASTPTPLSAGYRLWKTGPIVENLSHPDMDGFEPAQCCQSETPVSLPP